MESPKSLVSRVLKIERADWRADTVLAELPNWDSFNLLLLVAELESGFKIQMTMEEAVKLVKISDIEAVLQRHGVALG